jgi:4-amino-4-deoxy-L-arabinose transferase-like glycosyltransferase
LPTLVSKFRLPHKLAVPALLLIAAVLAITSLVRDSITFDETSHLTAGLSYLKTGDFRLAPDHPPLAKVWCAWPLLLAHPQWPPPDDPDWRITNTFSLGKRWLFELNDGQRLLVIGRCMMVLLFLATGLTVYALARTLLGPPAALLALGLALLSPEMLAHGRLVTTDLPITLASALTLLTFARLLQRQTGLRLLLAAATLAAASLTKLSWPLVLPALVAMGAWALWRRRQGEAPPRPAPANVVASLLVMGLTTWLAIWTCYGWRSSIVAPPAADTPEARAQLDQTTDLLGRQWHRTFHDINDGHPRTGVLPSFLQFAAAHQLLPEAYLLGLALTMESTDQRAAYLCGEYSNTGWRTYFPIAFVLKTPLATILLIVAGAVALARRRAALRDNTLAVGLAVFVVIYFTTAVLGHFDIGHRHLLPIYPALYIVAAAAVSWCDLRAGKLLVGAACAWLLGATLYIHPHYLSYFNELAGGPRHGSRFLADSNLDWGQDLLRLADYARRHPQELPLKLAYFGSAQPTYYVPCEALPSNYPFEPPTAITPGTYVASITQLLGLYDPEIRDSFWAPKSVQAYATLAQLAATPADADPDERTKPLHTQAATEYADLRAKRLLNRLAHRPPDESIGYSLRVFHLDAADIDELTRP